MAKPPTARVVDGPEPIREGKGSEHDGPPELVDTMPSQGGLVGPGGIVRRGVKALYVGTLKLVWRRKKRRDSR